MKTGKVLRKAAAILTAVVLLAMPAGACAYDHDSYERSEDGMWYVDHFHGESVSVVLYELVEADSDRIHSKDIYMFTCTDGEFPADYEDEEPSREGFMGFQYIGADADKVGEIDGNPIWRWSFGVQPGTYAFADGNEWGGISTFTRDFRILSYTEGREEIALQDGDVIVLYALAGSKEWKAEVVDSFSSWAQELDSEVSALDGREFAEIEIVPDVSKPPQMLEEEQESTTLVEIEPAEFKEDPKDRSSQIRSALFGAVSLAILIGAAIYFKKRP